MNKKIIRIGSQAYSGSTMLAMMIANDPKGFSCGEVRTLFRPTRKHHFSLKNRCSCQEELCKIWEQVKHKGEKHLWKTLYSIFPNIDFFVDSSKGLEWIYDQMKQDKYHNLDVENVLIWKTPAEFAYSCMKRDMLKSWKKSYINYYSRYFQLIKSWYAIRYSELVLNPSSKLQSLCNLINIPYFKGKELYWKRKHHNLGGSNVARIHLYQPESKAYNKTKNILKKVKPVNTNDLELSKHKSIYYNTQVLDNLPDQVLFEIDNDPILKTIQNKLESTDVDYCGDKNFENTVKLNFPNLFLTWYPYSKFKRYALYIRYKYFS